MTSRKRGEVWWGVGGVLLVLAVVVTMVWLTQAARGISTAVRRATEAPGPPISRLDLPRVMGDVPLAPTLVMDEAATNDARTRLEAGLLLHRGSGQWIIVFASTQPFDATVAWYQRHLPGWRRGESPSGVSRHRDDTEPGRRVVAWWRAHGTYRDSLTLAQVPEIPDRILMFVSVPAPTTSVNSRVYPSE